MIKVKDNIYWIGIRDWATDTFHGKEMSTPLGTSYNSYIIKDKKTALIDVSKTNMREEYLRILKDEVGYENIDMVIVNHSEPDHGGLLLDVMERIGLQKPVYCTEMGKKFISKYFGDKFNFQVIKTGDEVSLGDTTLSFVEMRMIHWPDSMMTYAKESAVLFSNDAFGQHVTNGGIFDDEIDECRLFYEALKYYTNILTPFNKLISKKLDEIAGMNLELSLIAPSHGVIWKKNIGKILELYKKWSGYVNNENVLIVYDTMYGASLDAAKAIGTGLEQAGVPYRIYNAATYDRSDLITELAISKGIVMGCPTLNNGVLSGIAVFLEEIRSMKFKGKYGAAFGTYGWSGEACKIISEALKNAGLEVPLEPVSIFLSLSDEDRKKCVTMGKEFADYIKQGQV